MKNQTFAGGTVILGGTVNANFYGPETTLDHHYGYMAIEDDVYVGTYICRRTDSRSGIAVPDVNLYVYKRFKPITDKSWGTA